MFDDTQTGCFSRGGVGWGGVGWGGDDDVPCTCTHVWCYAHGMFLSGWGGVGWGWWRSSDLHTCLMLRTRDVSLGVGWGGVGWGWWRTLHLHTCLMLRTRDVSLGVGWGGVGMMTFPRTCTHVWCYAHGMFLSEWGGVGWGGVGMMTFLGLAHMVDMICINILDICFLHHVVSLNDHWTEKNDIFLIKHNFFYKNEKTHFRKLLAKIFAFKHGIYNGRQFQEQFIISKRNLHTCAAIEGRCSLVVVVVVVVVVVAVVVVVVVVVVGAAAAAGVGVGVGGGGGGIKFLHIERKNNKCRSLPPALPLHM